MINLDQYAELSIEEIVEKVHQEDSSLTCQQIQKKVQDILLYLDYTNLL